jgi:acetyl esterase/lipase
MATSKFPRKISMKELWLVLIGFFPATPGLGQTAPPPTPSPPPPTHANVVYGPHERNVLDFWRAESREGTPVMFFIHGGGWNSGDKSRVAVLTDMPRLLGAGISIVSINYRYVAQAQAAGIIPPVKGPLLDAARALQFVRSKAEDWHLDKQRIGATGGSAGACSALWLALHDDLADPKSADLVARESTRLLCAALGGAQTSLDPRTMREWIPNITYGAHAFGFHPPGTDLAKSFQKFHDARDSVLPFIREYSPLEHASADDPPLWLSYDQKTVAVKGEPQKDPTHSALFGLMLEEKLKSLGVDLILTYPAHPAGDHRSMTDYIIARLKP